MKLIFIFIIVIVSFLSGEVLFRSNAYISKDQNLEGLDSSSSKSKRTLRAIEREITEESKPDLQKETLEKDQSLSPELEEFLNVFYLNQKRQLFVHPKSVLDLRVVTSSPANSLLYFGFEKDKLELFEFPIRLPEGASFIYYANKENSPFPDSFFVIVDNQNPSIVDMELVGNVYTSKNKQVFSVGTEFNILVKDSDSGIKAIRLFNQNGTIISSSQVLFEQKKEYSKKFPLTDPTIKQMIVEVEDNVSNVFRTQPIPIEIDGNPPSLKILVEPQRTELEETNELCALGTKVSVSAQDNESEVAEIQYRYPNKDWKPYTSRLVLAKPGEYKIEFRAKDYFGNISMPVYFECNVVKLEDSKR